MSHRGWSLNALQHPPCLHLCVTSCHVGKARDFIRDLLASTLEAAAASGKVKLIRATGIPHRFAAAVFHFTLALSPRGLRLAPTSKIVASNVNRLY